MKDTKNLFWIGIGLYVFLVFSTLVPATADVIEQAQAYFTPEEIANGQAYSFQRRCVFWGYATSQLALLLVLAFRPVGKRLYLWCGALVHSHWLSHVMLLAGIYWLASGVISIPFSLVGYFLSRAWGMTQQSVMSWAGDHLLAFFVSIVVEMIVLIGFYLALRFAPKWWWAVVGVGGMILAFLFATILPIVIAPLFNTFTPLQQTEWKSLEPRIRDMVKRAEASTSAIYVVDASRQGNHGNAYFTGFGSSQRIVLYDNLLKKHSADEVETIVAHELGHWYHRHIIQGILWGGLIFTGALYLLSLYLNHLVEAGALRSAADPAGLYRLLLIATMAMALSLPVQNAVSRRFERQADDMALRLSSKPQAFINAEINLSKQNIGNVAPSRWNVLLFASHPPVVDRIREGEAWLKK